MALIRGKTKAARIVQQDDPQLNRAFKARSGALVFVVSINGPVRPETAKETAMSFFKSAIAAALLAGMGAAALPAAASAGTWYLNARACPDLREDRRDRRVYEGRWDVREDRRDRRVIECPPRAWTYVPDRWERRNGLERGTGARLGTPGIVYRRHGEFYRETRRGDLRQINVVIERGRRGVRDHRRDRRHDRRSRYGSYRH
ncbi:hypothetical protein [Maricaulis sp.]|uniref:hypothetical protein n=1 Tax=Maricaulis sp. TaxID=1486257 RepID=UPI00262FF484|nr:hypothetical protein [Maricaulis sp.]